MKRITITTLRPNCVSVGLPITIFRLSQSGLPHVQENSQTVDDAKSQLENIYIIMSTQAKGIVLHNHAHTKSLWAAVATYTSLQRRHFSLCGPSCCSTVSYPVFFLIGQIKVLIIKSTLNSNGVNNSRFINVSSVHFNWLNYI